MLELEPILGYLNFSEGRPDPRFQRQWNDAYAHFSANSPAPWNELRLALEYSLASLKLAGKAAFAESVQAESALRIAETGHLTFGTLHTNSASSTINRIIDVFPAHQQPQIRAQLSLVLEGIMCQSLLAKPDGKGRAMAMEILIPNAAVRNLIREDKIHQIYSAMQSGQDKYGMQTFNQSLATLYFQKQITMEVAMARSSNQDELQEMINRGASLVGRQTGGVAAKGTATGKH